MEAEELLTAMLCFEGCHCSENGVGLQREAETRDEVMESPDGIHIPSSSYPKAQWYLFCDLFNDLFSNRK